MKPRTSLRVTGVNQAIQRMRDLGEDADGAMLQTVADLTAETHRIALDSIRPGAGPSAPGDFPNEVTGELKREIKAEMPTRGAPVGHVGTAWNIGRWLELGTSKMRPRPWLLRSFRRATRGAAKRLKAEFMGRV